jgi:hypothetical protein
MVEQKILAGQPPNPADKVLIDAYRQDLVKQADRYDDLAKELIKLELAIPGIFAAALKLIVGAPPAIPWVIAAFVCWLTALILTMMALFPKKYTVMENAVRRDTRIDDSDALSVEEYFRRSTQDKRQLLKWSAPLFFAGIAAAATAVLI